MSETEAEYAVVPAPSLTHDQKELVKRMYAKGASDDELKLFLYTAERLGLDPLAKQIHLVQRWDKKAGRSIGVIQTGIDGYRAIAARTGVYAGNDDPVFTYAGEAPVAATVTVWKMVAGQRCAFSATARWDEYYPGDKQGFMWRSKPHVMLGKCAEAQALRKAFPSQLSGVYVDEEMHQAGEVVNGEATEVRELQASPASPPRPWPPATVREYLKSYANTNPRDKISDKARGLLVGKINEALLDSTGQGRHLFLEYVTGEQSSKKLNPAMTNAMLQWLIAEQDQDTNEYVLDRMAVQELALVAKQALVDAGQLAIEDLYGEEQGK